jgi:tetratricopeptide (TPR) repeat protein
MNVYQLEQLAIDAAIDRRFEEAIKHNKEILKVRPDDLGALLRLGFAKLQYGELAGAKKAYKSVLTKQSENVIAQENLERIAILEQKGSVVTKKREDKLNPNLFLEIPGKTKSSVLVNLGQKEILAHLNIGDQLELKVRRRKLEVRSDGEYVGSMPDDLSKRLYVLIKGGSDYSCFIKEISMSRVVVFIREEKKSKRLARFSSFPRNIQSNLNLIEQASEGALPENTDLSLAQERVEDDEEDDEVTQDEVERMAENLGTEEKEEFYDLESDPSDDDEENLEE